MFRGFIYTPYGIQTHIHTHTHEPCCLSTPQVWHPFAANFGVGLKSWLPVNFLIAPFPRPFSFEQLCGPCSARLYRALCAATTSLGALAEGAKNHARITTIRNQWDQGFVSQSTTLKAYRLATRHHPLPTVLKPAAALSAECSDAFIFCSDASVFVRWLVRGFSTLSWPKQGPRGLRQKEAGNRV